MAPLRASGSPSRLTPTPQSPPMASRSALSSPKDIELPPSPEHETSPQMAFLSPQITMESEGDLESENELPTMTPPPAKQLPLRPRNTSPHHDRNSTPNVNHNTYAVQPMQRAHSSPGTDMSGRIVTPTHHYPRRPPSPLSSGRRRSPLRSPFEEFYPGSSWSSLNIEPNIPEHAELEISSPVTPENEYGSMAAIPTYTNFSNTFPRSRRRPASPLHQSASAPSLHNSARAASLNMTSNAHPTFSTFPTAKYANEPYPSSGYSFSSASSMPSTPTSLRSRSPSISSLETIEDTPDAEEAARLEEEHTKQRMSEETDSGLEPRRKSLDLRVANLRSNKDRKRWSVCGAERRADFSLEPIEE